MATHSSINAGKSFVAALGWAQANANYHGSPRFLHTHDGNWWVDQDRPNEAAIQVNPEPGYGQTQELPPLKEE